jgi:tRNA(Ile)-lysidine synthase
MNTTIAKLLSSYFSDNPTEPRRIIVGLSGGPDSIYLLIALHEYAQQHQLDIIAAHLNHGWRETAQRDADFCQELCEQYNIPIIVEHADNIKCSRSSKGSLEARGRLLRRTFLEARADEHNTPLIALGHHQDDQIETFFMRLARGSTIDGLRCMRTIHGRYFRPLLMMTKATIIQSLNERNISFVHDESNDSDDFLRNRIRHRLLPALETTDQRFQQSILKTIDHFDEIYTFVAVHAQHIFQIVFKKIDLYVIGNRTLFLDQPLIIRRMVILHWLIEAGVPFTPQQALLDEIIRFISHSSGGSHQLGQLWTIVKKKQSFWIEK